MFGSFTVDTSRTHVITLTATPVCRTPPPVCHVGRSSAGRTSSTLRRWFRSSGNFSLKRTWEDAPADFVDGKKNRSELVEEYTWMEDISMYIYRFTEQSERSTWCEGRHGNVADESCPRTNRLGFTTDSKRFFFVARGLGISRPIVFFEYNCITTGRSGVACVKTTRFSFCLFSVPRRRERFRCPTTSK